MSAMSHEEAEVKKRIADINDDLHDLKEMERFAASTDLDYRMIDAQRDGLKVEREKLKEILGDL